MTQPIRQSVERPVRRTVARSKAIRLLQDDVLEAVAAGESLDRIGVVFCRHVQRLTPEVICAILTIDDRSRLRPLAYVGLPEEFRRYLDGLPVGANAGSCEAAACLDGPTEVLDIDIDPQWRLYKDLLVAAGLRACWSSPIKGRDSRVVGALVFYYRAPRPPNKVERCIVEVTARLCAIAIEQEEVWRRLQLASHRFHIILNNMSQGVSFFSAHRLIVANRRYSEIYSLPPASVIPGMTLQQILDLRVAAGSGPAMSTSEYITRFDTIQASDTPTDSVVELANGQLIAIHHHPLPNSEWVSTHEDITDRRRVEAQLIYMAHHDVLTDLPNRVLFETHVQQALTFSGNGLESAVLCISLSHVKVVNETFGRSVGDGLLQNAASRLRKCVREIDLIGRLGDNLFAVLQVGITSPMEAEELAQRIAKTLGEPYLIDKDSVVVRTNIGIAVSPHDGGTSRKLLKSAEVALSRVKTGHHIGYRFFEPEMDARIQNRFALERDLREACVNKEFELIYQPIVSLESDRICGFEAMIRWRHRIRGLILPCEFVACAEETGLIIPIGDWVLVQACEEAARWPAPVKIAVNLSAIQLQSRDIVDTVRQALLSSGLSAKRLELEITETVLLNNSVDTIAILHELRELGASIAMDDFGTGYSSLSYLRSFPFDKIKIDQSFVRDLSEEENTIAVVRAAIGLGRSLGMVTTAEGVETHGQLTQLRREGCDQAQGYLFSHPVSPKTARHMMSLGQDWWGGSVRKEYLEERG